MGACLYARIEPDVKEQAENDLVVYQKERG